MRKIDKVKWALYSIAEPSPKKVTKAKWVVYSAAALSTALLFVADGPDTPKIPKNLGD